MSELFMLYILFLMTSVKAMSGGRETISSRQYPFSVTLTDPILCGGSLISLDPPWVLTAAHCIENYVENERPSVMYGNRNFTKQSLSTIKRTVAHPLYLTSKQLETQVYPSDKNDLIPYDIALIELTEPLIESNSVNRIPIMINDSLMEQIETVGMGYTGLNQSHAKLLQNTFCKLLKTEKLKENNFNGSVTLVTSEAELCHGDSGSPLLYKSNGTYYLEGILNRILNAYDPDPNAPSCPLHNSNVTSFINAFVKPISHINWIMNVTELSKNALTDAYITAEARHTTSQSTSSASLSLMRGPFLEINWLNITLFFILNIVHTIM